MPADAIDSNDAARPTDTDATGIEHDVGEIREEVGEELRSIRDRARERAQSALNEARRMGRRAGDEVRNRGEELVDRQKNRTADHIGNYRLAAKRAADQLREEHDEVLAHYADSLANTLERAENYLRSRDVRELVRELESYTRRHPEVVFGGMFIAGLAAARFVKAANAIKFEDDLEYEESGGAYYSYEEYAPSDEPGNRTESNLGEEQPASGDLKSRPSQYQTT